MNGEAARSLMMRFCAASGNCEFGVAQRFYGAEPLDLFRWSNTGLGPLIRILRARFEGIGDPRHITVDTLPNGEYRVRHTGFNFSWHAFANIRNASAEDIRKREIDRMPFLARKMIEDLEAGDRIFVAKWGERTPEGVDLQLLDVSRLYGTPRFLLVREGGSTMVRCDDRTGFLWGNVPKFAHGARVPTTTDEASWLKLCRLAEASIP
jgi:hypothetical protein